MVIGVHAAIFSGSELIRVVSVVSIAAVAIVEVPVTAAGLLTGVSVDGYLVRVDDIDAASEVEIIVGVAPQGIVIAFHRAFHVGVDGLRCHTIDRQAGIGTAVYAVVEDRDNSLVVAGDIYVEYAVIVVFDLHLEAGPTCRRRGSTPGVITCIVEAVLSKIVIVVPGRSLAACFNDEVVVSFLNNLAGFGIQLLGNVDINVLVRDRTVVAVRHHEVNSCHCAVIAFIL